MSVDTLNRDALSPFASSAPTLRSIDDFANQSTVFLDAHSTASWTLPAHGSLLTGVYPDKHYATMNDSTIDASIWRLPRALGAAGYDTVAFTDGGYVSGHFFADGFDRYNDRVAQDSSNKLEGLPRDGKPSSNHGENIFDRALSTLGRFGPDSKPLFLFLQTYAIHDYFKQNVWAAEAAGIAIDDTKEYKTCIQGTRTCSATAWANLESLYAAEAQHLDPAFGRLIEAIDAVTKTRETIVIFVSDHGEGFDVANRRIHHGGRLHSDLVRIPLIARARTMPRGTKNRTLVSIADVPPTIMELAGLTPPSGLDGVSFAKPPQSRKHRSLFAMEHMYTWNQGKREPVESTPGTPVSLAVIDRDTWYVANRFAAEELYRRRTDPQQRNNLAPLATSSILLNARSLAATRLRSASDGTSVDLPPDVMRELQSLGYVGDESD